MKPNTRTAMRRLITQIREHLPFELPQARVCEGPCDGCSVKLLDYMEAELIAWEQRLDDGDVPDFGDLRRLAGTGKKIYTVMQKNGLVANTRETTGTAALKSQGQ